MSRNIKDRRLRLWKIRQEAKGYDVSKVRTLEDAEKFNQLKRKPKLKRDEVKADNTVSEPDTVPEPYVVDDSEQTVTNVTSNGHEGDTEGDE